jgi:hypothetical protein
MASTYSTSLRLELMATGDQSGTWGDTTNTNLGTLLEQAITGVLSVSQGDAELTLTSTDGASDQARNAVINLTGAMTAGRNVVVPTANKLYLAKNSTSGGFAVTVKTAAGTGVAVPAGTARWVYCDGTNVVDGQGYAWSSTATALRPDTSDGMALGTSSLMWADMFLASGGVVNWNNGNVTLTQSANALAFAGVTNGVSFDGSLSNTAGGIAASSTVAGTLLTLTSTDAGATSGPDFEQYRNSASPAANDILGVHYFYGKDSAGNKQEYASTQVTIVDTTSTSEDATSEDYVTIGGTRTAFIRRGALASGSFDSNAVGLPKGQLSFPATLNPSSDANTLDDYEEGTWTANLRFGGASVGITYSLRSTSYTKIGDSVRVGMYITLSSKGVSTGNVDITGLPFTSAVLSGIAVGYTTMTGAFPTFQISGAQIDVFASQAGQALDTAFTNTTTIRSGGIYNV